MPIINGGIGYKKLVTCILQGNLTAGGSNNRKYQLVQNYWTAAATPLSTKAQISAAFFALISPVFLLAVNNRYTNVLTAVRFPGDASDAFQKFSQVGAGNVAGDSMATSLAAYILEQTGVRGKMNWGCKHICPLSESDTTSGTDDLLNAAALTRFGNLATALLAGFTDGAAVTWLPAVIGGIANKPTPISQVRTNPTTVLYNIVNSVSVQARIGTMTHRKVKSL